MEEVAHRVGAAAVMTGIKIINQFTVDQGKVADLILDFDGKNSVIQKGDGTYVLQPIITATVKQSL